MSKWARVVLAVRLVAPLAVRLAVPLAALLDAPLAVPLVAGGNL